MGDPTSEQYADTLLDLVVSHYGVPRVIRSDSASVLIGHAIKALYKIYGITLSAGKPYLHRSIGLVERWHSTLKSLLMTSKVAVANLDWNRLLPLLQLAFNTAIAQATGYSPFFINHLREARLPADVTSSIKGKSDSRPLPAWVSDHLTQRGVAFDLVGRRLKVNALSAKRVWDLRHDVITSFNVGDLVLVIKGSVIDGPHPKGDEPTHGPFRVIKKLPRNNYKLADRRARHLIDEYPIWRLRAFPSRKTYSPEDSIHRYPVAAILGHRVRRIPQQQRGDLAYAAGCLLTEYLVRWRGFSKLYDRYRASVFLTDAFELLTAYRQGLVTRGQPLPPLTVEAEPTACVQLSISLNSFGNLSTRLAVVTKVPDVTPEHLPVETRELEEQPPISAEALKRPHFRAQQPSSNDREEPLPSEPMAVDSEPAIAVDLPEYTGTGDIFPAGTRVKVQFLEGWWPGLVIRTRLAKLPASVTKATGHSHERRIFVQYDDPDYALEVWEHGLRGTPVRILSGVSPPPPVTGGERKMGEGPQITGEGPQITPMVVEPGAPLTTPAVQSSQGLVTTARAGRMGQWSYLVSTTSRTRTSTRWFPSTRFSEAELQSFSELRNVVSQSLDRVDPVLPPATTGLGRRSSACEEADAVSTAGITDHLRVLGHNGHNALGDPYREEVPFEFGIQRGQGQVYASPCLSDGEIDYSVRVRVWLAGDCPFEGSIQPSMWFDRLQARVGYLKSVLRSMLQTFEAHTDEWPEDGTISEYLADLRPGAIDHILDQYVLCLESSSARSPNGLCTFIPPAEAAKGPIMYPGVLTNDVPMLITIDLTFHSITNQLLMFRKLITGNAHSLLEGVSLLVVAHQYGHMQHSVRLQTPDNPLSESELSLHHGLNEALYTPDCDGDEINRPYYGGPPTPFNKEDYVFGRTQDRRPWIGHYKGDYVFGMAQDMFPGPAAVSASIDELVLMHANQEAWADEVMVSLRAAYAFENNSPSLADYARELQHARFRTEDRGPEDPLLLRNRTIEFAISEGGDVWNFVHQFLTKAISIMPVLGVVPYINLYKGVALYVVSLRLYTADNILAHSHLVEPRQLGQVLINGPVQHYLDSRPNAARHMLSQHGFTFAPGENFRDQLLTHWHQLSLEAAFPEHPNQHLPRAYQPARQQWGLSFDKRPRLRWYWPPYTTNGECYREEHAVTSYEAWHLAWLVGCSTEQLDHTDDSSPMQLSLNTAPPPSPPHSPPSLDTAGRTVDRDDPVLPPATKCLGRHSSACEEADAVSGRSGNSRRARRHRRSHPQRAPAESEPHSEQSSTATVARQINDNLLYAQTSSYHSNNGLVGIGAVLQLQPEILGSEYSTPTEIEYSDITHRNSDQLSRLAHIFTLQPSAATYLSCLNIVVPAVRTLGIRLFSILHTLHLPEIEDRLQAARRSRVRQTIAKMEANGLIRRSNSTWGRLQDTLRTSNRFARLEAAMPAFESAARQLVADFGARIAAAQAHDPTTRTLIEWIQSGRRRHPDFQEHVLERHEVNVAYTVNSIVAVQIDSYSSRSCTFLLSRDQRPSSSSAVHVSSSVDNPIRFYRLPAEHGADVDDPQAYELVQDTDRVLLGHTLTHCQQGGYVSGVIFNTTGDTILVPQVTATLCVDKAVGDLYKPPWVRQCEVVGNLLCYRDTGRLTNIWVGRAPEPSRESSTPDRLLPIVPVCCRAHEIRRFHDAASVRRVEEVWDDFRFSVWWPTITEDIWDHVNKCLDCTFTTDRHDLIGTTLVLPNLPYIQRLPTLRMALPFDELFQACNVELHFAHNQVTQDRYGYCLGCQRPLRSVEIGWPMVCPGCNSRDFIVGCSAFPRDYIERNVVLSWCHEYFRAYGFKLESSFKNRRRWLRARVFISCYLRLLKYYTAIVEHRLAPGGAGYLEALNEFEDLSGSLPPRPPSPPHHDAPSAVPLLSASDLRAEDPVERGRSVTQASSLGNSASQSVSARSLHHVTSQTITDEYLLYSKLGIPIPARTEVTVWLAMPLALRGRTSSVLIDRIPAAYGLEPGVPVVCSLSTPNSEGLVAVRLSNVLHRPTTIPFSTPIARCLIDCEVKAPGAINPGSDNAYERLSIDQPAIIDSVSRNEQIPGSNPLNRLAAVVSADRPAYRRRADVVVLYHNPSTKPVTSYWSGKPVPPSLEAVHAARDLIDALTESHDLPPSYITAAVANTCGVLRPQSSTHRAIAASAYRILHPGPCNHACRAVDVPPHLRASTRCMIAWHVALSRILAVAIYRRPRGAISSITCPGVECDPAILTITPPPSPPGLTSAPVTSSLGSVIAACMRPTSFTTHSYGVVINRPGVSSIRWYPAFAFTAAELATFADLRANPISPTEAELLSPPAPVNAFSTLTNEHLATRSRLPYCLSCADQRHLSLAQAQREPLVLRHVFPGGCSQLADSWDSFVTTDTLRYTTNEGVPTDRARGQSTHCRGPATLAEVRQQPLRIETDLGDLTEINPVEAWLLQAPRHSVANGVHRLLVQLSIISLRDVPASTSARRPAFITGNILVGDPCQVHWDEYNSLAVVIQGCKTFYIAAPSAFVEQTTRRGASHVLPGVSPFDDYPTGLSPWIKVVLQAGDVLYLPQGWWHAVVSEPLSIMTNIWVPGVSQLRYQ